MKNIVVLGAGTAGTMAANMLTKEKVLENWTITVVDKNNDHEYQPGFLFVPFGMMLLSSASRNPAESSCRNAPLSSKKMLSL